MKLFTTVFATAAIVSLTTLLAFSLQADTDKIGSVAVVLETTLGDINIEVYPDKAPLSAASFLAAIDGHLFHHSGATFYRVVHQENDIGSPKIAVIQGGITDHTKSLPLITHETTQQTGLLHRDGTVSLARGNGSSGSGSTFFICIGDQPALDFGGTRYADGQGFAAFGKVTEGMDIVRRIQHMNTQTSTPDNRYAQQMLVEPVALLRAYRK